MAALQAAISKAQEVGLVEEVAAAKLKLAHIKVSSTVYLEPNALFLF